MLGGATISRSMRKSTKIFLGLAIALFAMMLFWPHIEWELGLGPSPRAPARRAWCRNNLKQIGLALHNYNDMHGHFPGDIVDKDDKPLLSWRVAILPYLDKEELYQQFKLNEPWDGPHNKSLLDEIPEVYRCPSPPRSAPTLTNCLGFEGKGAFFEKGQEITIESLKDGAGSTLMVVEAKAGAPWTKPADLPFDPNAPPSLYGAGSRHWEGFNALFADGMARFLKTTTRPAIMRALITLDGGEVVSPDDY